MAALRWTVVHGGKSPPPGHVVRPGERLSWPRTVGLGAQHVVAMFGATFVFPLIMGLDPNVAIMFSGIATILFLLIVGGKVPSYLGTSASFVAGVAAIRAQGGDSADVTGAILVSGLVLAAVGVFVHFSGADKVSRVLPPAVTGAVVMLIGFNLAPVVAGVYWPQDQWVALLTVTFTILAAVLLKGFWGRIAIFLGLIFGYAVSYFNDLVFGAITSPDGTGTVTTRDRISLGGVEQEPWLGLPDATVFGGGPDGMDIPGFHGPSFSLTFIVLVLPGVIALIAENAGHVKAVAEMTGDDLDPSLGRALFADGFGTALASAFGGSPTTTYAENIGVMAATRVYSTAAYYVAAVVAILLGFSPKFGAVVYSIPGGVLAGITLVLYGMIGLLGAKIWVENRVDFGNPINLVPLSAGIIAGVGDVKLDVTDDFQIGGIALGTIFVIVYYHLVRAFGGPLTAEPQAAGRSYEGGTMMSTGTVDTPDGPSSPFREDTGHDDPGPR